MKSPLVGKLADLIERGSLPIKNSGKIKDILKRLKIAREPVLTPLDSARQGENEVQNRVAHKDRRALTDEAGDTFRHPVIGGVVNPIRNEYTSAVNLLEANKKALENPEIQQKSVENPISEPYSNRDHPLENPLCATVAASNTDKARKERLYENLHTITIDHDTGLSLQLNFDYLSASMRALYNTDADVIDTLLHPIKDSLKQLLTCEKLEEKQNALEKLKFFLTNFKTNLTVNISTLGLIKQSLKEAPQNELENILPFLMELSVDRPLSRIKEALRQLITTQEPTVRKDTLNNILLSLGKLSISHYTSNLIKDPLEKFTEEDFDGKRSVAYLNDLNKELENTLVNTYTVDLIKESQEKRLATQDVVEKDNELKKIRLFLMDLLVKSDISRFLNGSSEKNAAQGQVNQRIYQSIRLPIDAFIHTLSKIELILSLEKQNKVDNYRLEILESLAANLEVDLEADLDMLRLNPLYEKSQDYLDLIELLLIATRSLHVTNKRKLITKLEIEKKPKDALKKIAQEPKDAALEEIEDFLEALCKEENLKYYPKIEQFKEKSLKCYLKIKQYYGRLKFIAIQLDQIGNAENFQTYLGSYTLPSSLTTSFFETIKMLTNLLTADNIPLEKSINTLKKFDSILSNMQECFFVQAMSSLKSKETTDTFLNQLNGLIAELFKEEYFSENSFGQLNEINALIDAIDFSKLHLEHIAEKQKQEEKEISHNVKNEKITLMLHSNQYRDLKNRVWMTYFDIYATLAAEPLLDLLESEISIFSALDRGKKIEKTTYIQSLIRLDQVLETLREKILPHWKEKKWLNQQIFNIRQELYKHKKLSISMSNEEIHYDFEISKKEDLPLPLKKILSDCEINIPFTLKDILDIKKFASTQSVKTVFSKQYLTVKKAFNKNSLFTDKQKEALLKLIDQDTLSIDAVKKTIASNSVNHSSSGYQGEKSIFYEFIALKLNYLKDRKKLPKILAERSVDNFALAFNKLFVENIIALEPLFIRVLNEKSTNKVNSQFLADFLALAKNIFDPLYTKTLDSRDQLKKMQQHLIQLHSQLLTVKPILSFLSNKNVDGKKDQDTGKSIVTIDMLLPLVVLAKTQVTNLLSACKQQTCELTTTKTVEKETVFSYQAIHTKKDTPTTEAVRLNVSHTIFRRNNPNNTEDRKQQKFNNRNTHIHNGNIYSAASRNSYFLKNNSPKVSARDSQKFKCNKDEIVKRPAL